MRVISIGTDRKLFEEGSSVLARSLEYAKHMEELHIIVFTKKSLNLERKSIGNLHLYPTNSMSRFLYIYDAIRIGRSIIQPALINNPDSRNVIVSSQDPFETGYVGYKLKKIFKIPLQIQIHTDFLSKNFSKNFLNKIRLYISKKVLPNANRIRVVSSVVRDSIIHKYPKMAQYIDILPVFVDIEKIVNTSPTRNLTVDFPDFKFIVLMASRLEKEKNINTALNAFKKVLEKHPLAGLVIAGDGSEKESLMNIARDLKIDSRVKFIGWQDDLISLYKTADLFLLTSAYEGYGVTLIEAGASGCPVVTTKVGVAKTDLFLNKINSVVCETFDDICIAEGIIETIEDNQARESRKHKMQNDVRLKSMNMTDYSTLYVGLLTKTV